MYQDRKSLFKKLEAARESRVLLYVTGDRQGLETQIHPEVLDYFADHLDAIGIVPKISLILYSPGGSTLAGWSIVNLIRQFCGKFEVIIPSKAHSTATLISIGANSILMTKQATLGPIDPSVNSPLNPPIPGAPPNARLPISVEAVAGYFDLAKRELGLSDQSELTQVYLKLADQVHPIALGNVYRARTQIQMLASRLLHYHMQDEIKIKKIISVLCSESGSHDYTINRREARDELGLPIEKPDDELYSLIKGIYTDFRNELELKVAFSPELMLGQAPQTSYAFTRALIESRDGGLHRFVSKGVFTRQKLQIQPGIVQDAISDQKTFEGWTHEPS